MIPKPGTMSVWSSLKETLKLLYVGSGFPLYADKFAIQAMEIDVPFQAIHDATFLAYAAVVILTALFALFAVVRRWLRKLFRRWRP